MGEFCGILTYLSPYLNGLVMVFNIAIYREKFILKDIWLSALT